MQKQRLQEVMSLVGATGLSPIPTVPLTIGTHDLPPNCLRSSVAKIRIMSDFSHKGAATKEKKQKEVKLFERKKYFWRLPQSILSHK